MGRRVMRVEMRAVGSIKPYGRHARVNDAAVGPEFYENTDQWHVTLGDSDQDR